MATVTLADVVLFVPELKSYSETPEGVAAINALIPVVLDMLDEADFGARFTYAAALLVGHHLLTLNPSLGGVVSGTGAVASTSVGGVSVSYVTDASASEGKHGTTRPGALYDDLVKGIIPTMLYLPATWPVGLE